MLFTLYGRENYEIAFYWSFGDVEIIIYVVFAIIHVQHFLNYTHLFTFTLFAGKCFSTASERHTIVIYLNGDDMFADSNYYKHLIDEAFVK